MNIGKHIEEILRKQGRSAAWLATQIPCERTNVYNIFNKVLLNMEHAQLVVTDIIFNFLPLKVYYYTINMIQRSTIIFSRNSI